MMKTIVKNCEWISVWKKEKILLKPKLVKVE